MRLRGRVPMQCGFCGALGHEAWRCRNAPPLTEPAGSPVEHQGGNGVYTGPVQVRVIPRGVSGEELGGGERRLNHMDLARIRGINRQQQIAKLKREMEVGRDLSGAVHDSEGLGTPTRPGGSAP